MDRALDEIVSERHRGGRTRGRRGGRRPDRSDYPRDGVRKSTREDSRNIDSEWVHDKFDDNPGRRPFRSERERRYSPERTYESASAKLRVENLHYDLTEEDLDDLFNRIGPVLKLSLVYDRAGRSEGIAYVTYDSASDAKRAIREFDGANAKGQPIRLTSVPAGPQGGRRNPFDSAVVPGRSLADRITLPPSRGSRSQSPIRHSDVSGPPPSNVDRYVPGRGDRGDRSRSPRPRQRDGRRPGARRERGDRRGGRGGGSERLARDGRPKKTQEELDAEMEDYWGAKENGTADAAGPTTAAAPAVDDVEMVE
ncbi:putative RNA binding protein [Halenospora varia]|nr:putative RNA binding protein [Halenospora varia]